jgi:hypothetical protein
MRLLLQARRAAAGDIRRRHQVGRRRTPASRSRWTRHSESSGCSDTLLSQASCQAMASFHLPRCSPRQTSVLCDTMPLGWFRGFFLRSRTAFVAGQGDERRQYLPFLHRLYRHRHPCSRPRNDSGSERSSMHSLLGFEPDLWDYLALASIWSSTQGM